MIIYNFPATLHFLELHSTKLQNTSNIVNNITLQSKSIGPSADAGLDHAQQAINRSEVGQRLVMNQPKSRAVSTKKLSYFHNRFANKLAVPNQLQEVTENKMQSQGSNTNQRYHYTKYIRQSENGDSNDQKSPKMLSEFKTPMFNRYSSEDQN